jgi:hypothetical protein
MGDLKEYTLRFSEKQLGTLMIAVETTRNKYRESLNSAPQLAERIKHLEELYGLLRQALELNLAQPGGAGKPT